MKPVKNLPAKLTGIETEGELAGQVVCEKIYLWRITNRDRMREYARYNLPHDTEVIVDRETTNVLEEHLYHVRKADHRSIHGWVTERFVLFDG